MEADQFSPLIFAKYAAPFTRKLLGNSLTKYNKLFNEKYSLKQKYFSNPCVAGLGAITSNMSEMPMNFEMQQMSGTYHSPAEENYLSRHMKKDETKFALIFKLKREELKQVQNGDITILKMYLKGTRKGAILNKENYRVLPYKNPCEIMEKIRQETATKTVLPQLSNIKLSYSTLSLPEKQKLSDTNSAQSVKRFARYRPTLSDKFIQYENLGGICVRSDTSSIPNESKNTSSNKSIQCDLLTKELETLQKALKDKLYMFFKAKQYQTPEHVTDNISTTNKDLGHGVEHSITPKPEDSLIIIRKKFMNKKYERIQAGQDLLHTQPKKTLESDFGWLSEETQPHFASSGDDEDNNDPFGNGSLLPSNLSEPDLEKYKNSETSKRSSSNGDTKTGVLNDQFEFVSKALLEYNNTLNSKDRPFLDLSFTDSFKSNHDNLNLFGANGDTCYVCTKVGEVSSNKGSKIPVPIGRTKHFQHLLKKRSVSKIQLRSSEVEFSVQSVLSNERSQLDPTEGGRPSKNAFYDCQKLSSKGHTEFLQHDDCEFKKSNHTCETMPCDRFRLKTRIPVMIKKSQTSTKQIGISAKNVKVGDSENKNSAKNKELNKHEKDKTPKETIEIKQSLPLKSILSKSSKYKNKTYNEEQRKLVELIVRGVEHEIRAKSRKEGTLKKL